MARPMMRSETLNHERDDAGLKAVRPVFLIDRLFNGPCAHCDDGLLVGESQISLGLIQRAT